jgi:hypothetical protein
MLLIYQSLLNVRLMRLTKYIYNRVAEGLPPHRVFHLEGRSWGPPTCPQSRLKCPGEMLGGTTDRSLDDSVYRRSSHSFQKIACRQAPPGQVPGTLQAVAWPAIRTPPVDQTRYSASSSSNIFSSFSAFILAFFFEWAISSLFCAITCLAASGAVSREFST